MTIILAMEDVNEGGEPWPVEANARITGKCFGLASAITALAATISFNWPLQQRVSRRDTMTGKGMRDIV